MDGTTSPYAPPTQGPTAVARSRTSGPPTPWIAGLLSFFARGAGQVYAGRPLRGVAWAVTLWALYPAILAVARAARGATFLVGSGIVVAATLLLHAGAVVDAGRIARAPAARRAPTWLSITLGLTFFLGFPFTAILTRRFALEAFKIPSGSMMPTLLIGDHIFVDKSRAPKGRGEVVVFPFPERPDQDFVKRVLAVAGDRIEFQDSHPIVNGARVPSCLVGPWQYREEGEDHDGDLFLESIDGRAYLAFYDRGSLPYGHQGPWTVPPGEIFVVGDNRNNAFDSRMWRGGTGRSVRVDTVRGVAYLVFLAADDMGGLDRAGQSLEVPGLPVSAASLKSALASCEATLAAR